jgi:hypothetical protein
MQCLFTGMCLPVYFYILIRYLLQSCFIDSPFSLPPIFTPFDSSSSIHCFRFTVFNSLFSIHCYRFTVIDSLFRFTFWIHPYHLTFTAQPWSLSMYCLSSRLYCFFPLVCHVALLFRSCNIHSLTAYHVTTFRLLYYHSITSSLIYSHSTLLIRTSCLYEISDNSVFMFTSPLASHFIVSCS